MFRFSALRLGEETCKKWLWNDNGKIYCQVKGQNGKGSNFTDPSPPQEQIRGNNTK